MPITTTALQATRALLKREGYKPGTRSRPVHGGDISESLLLETLDGQTLFAKYNGDVAADFFPCEAANLACLEQHTELRVPAVIACNQQCLVLEYLGKGEPANDYFAQLAQGLACLHRQQQPCFGFHTNNYCGASRQPNPKTGDGYEFFSEHRLQYQFSMAMDKGHLDPADQRGLNALIKQLPSLLPNEPAVLLHGDLWQGNVYCDSDGNPCLIDPACYWGWRESDIAMTTLFGGFPEAFYQHYQQLLPMNPGWKQRLPIYNLYHLLNHLNLFGAQYQAAVRELINRYR